MTYREVLKKSRLYPVLILERYFSEDERRRFFWFSSIISLIATVLIALTWLDLFQLPARLVGFFAIYLGFYLLIWALENYFRSYYFPSIISNNYQPADQFTFTVGRLLISLSSDDILVGLTQTVLGQKLFKRLGLDLKSKDWQEFLAIRSQSKSKILTIDFTPPVDGVLTLREFCRRLYEAEPAWTKWLRGFAITQEDLLAVASWLAKDIEWAARASRWWSRDNLERISGLAKTWSYGGTFTLDQYARDLLLEPGAGVSSQFLDEHAVEITQLENVLGRSRETNALLVGPTGESKMAVIWQLAREIKSGRIIPSLEAKRLLLLNTSQLIANCPSKDELEATMLKIFKESRGAGNVLLVIDDLGVLYRNTKIVGFDLFGLLDPFLAATCLPLIILVDTKTFQEVFENQAGVMRRFEVVKVKENSADDLIDLLESEVAVLEAKYRLTYSYPALKAVVAGAERYLNTDEGGTLFDQVLDVIAELTPVASRAGKEIIGADDVLAFIANKTNIPIGLAKPADKSKLLKLEELLSQRVIGQRLAIQVIAKAIRRSRSGINNAKRPIGSFLFLGPTGVGKTETAKALAQIYFGDDEAMVRLDMSEYQGAEALSRLIGDFKTGQVGILAKLLRQNPYCLVLLDEFEKADREALNLFLQILDEGFFSDAFGRRVNARNVIFIATSNAGAKKIWELIKVGTDLALEQGQLIDWLVSQGFYRPELLNRFDGIIIFQPLGQTELAAIAKLQLGKLGKRLLDQGITLQIDQALISQVVKSGSDPVFGARPMNRYIQDQIEEVIARGLISGEVKAGDIIRLSDGIISHG